MTIDLTQFEQQIDPVILKRGLQYYKKGMVEILSESSDMVEAHVEGCNGEPYSTECCKCQTIRKICVRAVGKHTDFALSLQSKQQYYGCKR